MCQHFRAHFRHSHIRHWHTLFHTLPRKHSSPTPSSQSAPFPSKDLFAAKPCRWVHCLYHVRPSFMSSHPAPPCTQRVAKNLIRHAINTPKQTVRCLSLATNLEQHDDTTAPHSTQYSTRHQTTAIASRQFHQAYTQLLANTPYTLAAALHPTQQCRLVMHAPTLSIVHANDAFAQRSAIAAEELEGLRGLHFMAGPATNAAALDVLSAAARGGFKAVSTTTVYPSPSRPCMARLQVSPLLSNGQVDHALLVLTPLLSDEEQL